MNKYTDKIRPQTTHSMSRRPNNRPSGSITSRCATASTLLRPTLIFDNLLSTIDKPSITNR